jgi:4-hydroxybenzoate polyprenyltransferase
MYAMVDREDDLRIGVKSTAILFGAADRLMILLLQILLMVCLIWVGLWAGLGSLYYAGLAAAGGFALYQQYLIRERRPERCFQAFLNNNWFGAAVFAGIAVDYLFK